ncbi:efflux RND transporter periplasmic adaptor subunit [Peribacillus sp. NPDC097675]|uniref:efflux RND transporter periplasmic adaptor subunit n=1 Tax=Peribacillus sp. NPDC097675 TaxID=3390618 RepID=UPI003CFF5F73
MKKWKVTALSIVSVAFISGNIYLIEKKDSKVERTVFTENWVKVKKETITESFRTKGILKPAEEFDVYFDSKNNDFQKFLVREGDEVTAGTSLFEYTTTKLDALKDNLEAEKAAAQGEITGIDEYIKKLNAYQSSLTLDTNKTVIDETVEKNLNIDITTSSSDLIKSNIEQEKYKQELEKSSLKEKVVMLDAQLSSIEVQTNAVETTSQADGTVKNINKNLSNPIISIASSEMAIEGTFTEEQLKKATVGMELKAISPDLNKNLAGTISRIHSYPKEEPNLNEENRYPFQANIVKDPEVTEPLLAGSKVDLTVITNVKAGVPVVPTIAVHDGKQPHVYALTNKGYVNRQYLTKGAQAKGKQEILKGPTVGDVILLDPKKVVKNHSHFITPLRIEKINSGTFKKLSTREKIRYILLGILEK